MRMLQAVAALSLLLVWSGADAQSDAKSERPPPTSSKGVGTRALGSLPQDLRAQMKAWYEDCRKGWDVSTHMSKRDYASTCRRMAHERIKFLRDESKKATRAR